MINSLFRYSPEERGSNTSALSNSSVRFNEGRAALIVSPNDPKLLIIKSGSAGESQTKYSLIVRNVSTTSAVSFFCATKHKPNTNKKLQKIIQKEFNILTFYNWQMLYKMKVKFTIYGLCCLSLVKINSPSH